MRTHEGERIGGDDVAPTERKTPADEVGGAGADRALARVVGEVDVGHLGDALFGSAQAL